LSLTGVQAFLREDLTRFCRDAPAEFTHPQRDVFCVFSGDGVQRLRDYLLRLAMEQADREGRDPIDDSLLDGVESPGVDTMSDDGTIDGNDQTMDTSLPPRHISPLVSNSRTRPRPRSVHELPSYHHVELPPLPSDQVERFGSWTPGGFQHYQTTFQPGFPHQHLGGDPVASPSVYPFGRPLPPAPMIHSDNTTPAADAETSDPARTPSRRHTVIESSNSYFSAMPRSFTPSVPGQQPLPSMTPIVEPPRRTFPFMPMLGRPQSDHLWDLGTRSTAEVRQAFLRPEQNFSTFDANHEAIMATIPGSRSASRQHSRSNSPHTSRVSSRSRLSNILSSMRTNPFSSPENRGPFGMNGSRSASRSRLEDEHQQRMLHALAEADSLQQLRPDLRRAESSRSIELPLLAPDQIERINSAPQSATTSSPRHPTPAPSSQDNAHEDVTMGNAA
jgi:hypothetical protein